METQHAIHGDCQGQQGVGGRRSPQPELLTEMGKFNEQLVKAGVRTQGG
jgi:hypothetical protein